MISPLYTSMINKTDYYILEVLAIRSLTTPFYSAKIEQLMQYTGLSKTKVRNALRVFMMMGLIKEGNKDHRSKTYYITEQGEDYYLKIFDLEYEELEKARDNYDENNAQCECSISIDVQNNETTTDRQE